VREGFIHRYIPALRVSKKGGIHAVDVSLVDVVHVVLDLEGGGAKMSDRSQ
jgi:hypothetical protein